MQQSLFELMQGINVLPFDGEALFYQDFITEAESEFYMKRFQEEYSFMQVKIRMYDKEVFMPKLTAFCGEPVEDLDVSDEGLAVQPWSSSMLQLKNKVEEISAVKFTHALLNLYRDGKDSVSWHRDKERHWGVEPVIASVSLGAERTFQFRNTEDKKVVRSIQLAPGSLLIMKGTSQRCWEHHLPKTNKRIGPRLNITFRVLDRS